MSAHREDLERARACARGDAAAWRELVRANLPVMWSAAREMLGERAEETEEVCQETLAALCADGFRRLRSYRGESSLATWLRVVAARTALNHLRSGRRASAAEAAAGRPRAETPPPVAEILAPLAARDRAVLALYYGEGRTYREIAGVLGVSPHSVSSLIGRALQRARARVPGP